MTTAMRPTHDGVSILDAPIPRGEADSARSRAPAMRDGLHQSRFHTDGLDVAEACQAYLDRLDSILDTVFLAPFAAEMDAYRLGAFSVLCLTATARRSSRLPARIAQDRYDSLGIQYVVSGRATGEANGRGIASEPGTVMILDYGQPFSVTDLEARRVINVAVPRSLFARACDPADLHGTVLQGPAAGILAGFMDDLGRALPDLPDTAGTPLARVFIDLLTVAIDATGTPVPIDREARTIARAQQLVDDRIGSSELDPAWLCAKLNLSRSELYTVMERFGGVARFIMQRRLHGARAALLDPADTRRIGAIAYAYGFANEAHFARAFRATFGTTASSVRQAGSTERQKNLDG
jgi:AraC-like DNA-binding protein